MSRPRWIDSGYFPIEKRDLSSIRRVLIATMVLNFVAMAVKLAAGILTGSLSVVADGLDSLFDGLSNVVGLVGLYIASKPPDAEHPYGHRKFETLAALSIAFLLFLTCLQLLEAAWDRLGSRSFPQVNLWTVVAMLASMLIQAGTSIYELRQGQRLESELLIADAYHTRASILVSFSVLGGLGLVLLGYPQADAVLAAFVGLVIAKIGVDVLRETLPVLVDRAAVDPYQIAAVAEEVEGVTSLHRVRSRGATGSAAVDLHIRVPVEKTLQEANSIADEVRRRLLALKGVTDVTVHLEAQRTNNQDAREIFATLRHAASQLGLVVHEAWVHSLENELYTEIHVGVDPQLTLSEAHARVDRLEGEIQARLPQVRGVHTHIELAPSEIQVRDRASGELEGNVRREVDRLVAEIPVLQPPHSLVVQREHSNDEKLFIALECRVTPDLPVSDAHDLATYLEEELRRRLKSSAEISVHLEPKG